MEHRFEDVLVAELRLRFGRTVLPAQIYWPADSCKPAAAPFALLLADGATRHGADTANLLGRALSAGSQIVVLRVPDGSHNLAALAWATAHARELGGRPDWLMVAGVGLSGAHAAWLAIAARDKGWPPLHRQVLVHPRFTRACPPPRYVPGVVAATIVSGSGRRDAARRYAAQLQRGGVEIRELRQAYSRPGDVDDQMRMIADLARSLRMESTADISASLANERTER